MKATWQQLRLGELFRIKHGYAFKGKHFVSNGTLVVLTPGNFRAEGGLKLKGEKEKYYDGDFPEEFMLKRGDFLVAMTDLTQDAPILGSPLIVPEAERYLHNQRLGKLVDINETKVDVCFLFYLFNSPSVRSQIKGSATGATVRHTAPDRIYAVEVHIPPLPEQKRIAGILSVYDDLIENNLQRIKILEEMAQSLYREWFVHFRFPGHESVKMIDSPLGPIPEGWEVTSIDEVCERVTDGSHSSPKSVDQGMPMASSKDMHSLGLNLDTARTISNEDYDKLVKNGCRPEANDILITKDGANYLKNIFVVEESIDVVLLSSIAILTPGKRINPHLFAALLNSTENKTRLRNYVTGAAIPRIILKDFKRFQFALPPQELQEEWAKIGQTAIQRSWKLVKQNRTLRHTRDLLLPKLLTPPTS